MKKTIDNSLEEMISKNIRKLNKASFLYMDCFLNDEILFNNKDSFECFYIFQSRRSVFISTLVWDISSENFVKIKLSYKLKNHWIPYTGIQ